MERKIISVFLTLITLIYFCGCGSIGTETGNPYQQQDAMWDPGETNTYTSEEYGIEFSYPNDWYVASLISSETSDSTSDLPIMFIGEDGSTAAISASELNCEGTDFYECLADEYPDKTFTVYTNTYHSGYIYDDPEPGPNEGDIKEAFFMQDNILLHITVEVFESTGAETILSTIHFSE
jgi:hypothetical protein